MKLEGNRWPMRFVDASKLRYVSPWPIYGMHDTDPYIADSCAATTAKGFQCSACRGYGPNELYCKRHATKALETTKP